MDDFTQNWDFVACNSDKDRVIRFSMKLSNKHGIYLVCEFDLYLGLVFLDLWDRDLNVFIRTKNSFLKIESPWKLILEKSILLFWFCSYSFKITKAKLQSSKFLFSLFFSIQQNPFYIFNGKIDMHKCSNFMFSLQIKIFSIQDNFQSKLGSF